MATGLAKKHTARRAPEAPRTIACLQHRRTSTLLGTHRGWGEDDEGRKVSPKEGRRREVATKGRWLPGRPSQARLEVGAAAAQRLIRHHGNGQPGSAAVGGGAGECCRL